MTVDTDQQYQEIVEAASNMICQLRQKYDRLVITINICQINEGHDYLDIPAVEEVAHMSSCPILESMDFDIGIYDGVPKMREDTLLVDIFCPHKCTTNPLKYVPTKSKYGNFIVILDSSTQYFVSRSTREKCWLKNLIQF